MRFKTTVYFLLLIALFLLGAYFRMAHLDKRPMHGDEANQAVKFIQLLEEGEYRYDPNEHHGPSLYYFTLPFAWAFGSFDAASLSETVLRLTPVFFSLMSMLLLLPMRPVLGRVGVVVAMLLLATSPAMVFYSRYFIQETMLLTFTLAALVCLWRYWQRPTLWAVLGLGASLGLMHATKETCILFFGAIFLAAFIVYLLSPREHVLKDLPSIIPKKHLAVLIVAAMGISMLLFSAFFSHPRGILDSFLTYVDYASRAEGEGSTALHDHPWYYYLSLLIHTQREVGPHWSEVGILLLGGLGITLAWWPKSEAAKAQPALQYVRFLALFTVFLTVFFSAIPYKTPWNLLGFHLGFILLAGYGIHCLVGKYRHFVWRGIWYLVVGGIAAHLAWQSHLAIGRYDADPRNPYVYAHTSSAFMRFVERVSDIQAVHPEPEEMFIRVIQPDADYWPIPWYLRHLDKVGYYITVPDEPDADMIITDMALMEALDDRLEQTYQMEATSLRPGVLRLVYIEQTLWDRFMADRQ